MFTTYGHDGNLFSKNYKKNCKKKNYTLSLEHQSFPPAHDDFLNQSIPRSNALPHQDTMILKKAQHYVYFSLDVCKHKSQKHRDKKM